MTVSKEMKHKIKHIDYNIVDTVTSFSTVFFSLLLFFYYKYTKIAVFCSIKYDYIHIMYQLKIFLRRMYLIGLQGERALHHDDEV